MDRTQGTTLGAILLAALFFRTGSQRSPEPKMEDQPASATASAAKATGEGPWTASCQYWAPDHSYHPPAAEAEEVGSADIKESKETHDYHVTIKDSSKLSPCSGADNIWGIPTAPLQSGEAIIAIVPDPVITSMPLNFDRAVDALVTAAAHRPQRYQHGFYWLPWQPTRTRNQRNEESVSWEKKSKEPGLIILHKLKPADKPGDSDAKSVDPEAAKGPDTLYVFLVGETPTSGIDGGQMQRALAYRKALQGLFQLDTTESDLLRIIGPTFSGSAPSLARAVDGACATIRGATSTDLAAGYLNNAQSTCKCPNGGEQCRTDQPSQIGFQSFADNNVASRQAFISALVQSGVPPNQIALLVEQGTTLGAASGPLKKTEAPETSQKSGNDDCEPNSLHCYNVIQFPRNIFMLRNAYEQRNAKPQDVTPSPYLQLKLNGSTPTDDIPNFDVQMTPLSQEAQLMAIQHQLQRYHTKYILIWGSSNILDQIFLAQYFRRALPDARIVFNASDLLIERETDNTKLIGSLTVTPYHLIGLGNPHNPGFGGFAFPASDSDIYYNATTSILCGMTHDCFAEDFAAYKPAMADVSKDTLVSPPLWVTATGADGYYPLGVLKPSDPTAPYFLPGIPLRNDAEKSRFPLHPSSLWFLLCALLCFACILHAVILRVANYWSPITRWVAIYQNDDPERLSVYINIGTAALFSMACVVSIPLFACTLTIFEAHGWSVLTASLTLLSGVAALVCTWQKTGEVTLGLLRSSESFTDEQKPDRYFYRWFHRLALGACVLIPAIWLLCCFNLPSANRLTNVGSCFAFRCLYPQSGVSPLLPTLIVLAAWHLWAVIHTLRHRFSAASRPLMPNVQRCDSEQSSYQLYVTDQDLTANHPIASRLVSNITSLLITREIFMRFATDCKPHECHTDSRKQWHNRLVAIYFLAFAIGVFLPVIHTLDSMVWTVAGFRQSIWPWSEWHNLWRFKFTPFELLNRALFFPILVITLANWLRMVVVWGSLKRGVLQPLEQSPLRFAFDSIKATLRLSLFKQSGMREQWNDMARSTESIRQFINDENCKCLISGTSQEQDVRYERMKTHYDQLNQSIVSVINRLKLNGRNLVPNENSYMYAIEERYQELSTEVLSYILVPYWWKHKHGLVDSTGERPDIPTSESKPTALTLSAARILDPQGQSVMTLEPLPSAGPRSCAQTCIEAAEEFIAIRYVALIRAVLVNLRYTMIFVTMSFVYAITAWNSYPFQPKQLVNWVFTFSLILFGSGIVMVLTQMYHDPLLSRITNKKPNELGWDFIVKVASLIGLPLLSWLAYNYPEIGDTLFKIFQPGTGVVK